MPEQREEVLEYVTSWERRGIEKGRQEGRLEGRLEGRQEGRLEGRLEGQIEALRDVLLDVLLSRFGKIDERTTARIRSLQSVDELRRLTHEALTVRSIRTLRL